MIAVNDVGAGKICLLQPDVRKTRSRCERDPVNKNDNGDKFVVRINR